MRPASSPTEVRTVQCDPGPLGATFIHAQINGKGGGAVVLESSFPFDLIAPRKLSPWLRVGDGLLFGFLGLAAGIWIIATTGFVDKQYSIDREADSFWILVGLGVIVQSFFFSGFSLVSVITWENTS